MQVQLRKYPYPYQAMLAICSDLDETPNQDIYFETARYLNTQEDTLLGKGVGLEVGNTIYFDMPKHNFSYTNCDDQGRANLHKLIDSGHIDCLHSFGDWVNSRERIEECWSTIQKGKRKLEVWVDHAQAPSNFDNDIMQGKGALPGSDAFHSDLTVKSGSLAFIWKGRVTSVVAQNAKLSYASIFSKEGVIQSLKTLTLECLKGGLARLGNTKYAMHKENNLLRKTHLIDGTSTLEFMRSNPSWGGVSMFDTARGIHHVLKKSVLDTLVKQQGCSVFYSHLGKVFSLKEPFQDKTRQSFELLASYQDKGDILTATTRRTLGYCRTVDALDFTVKNVDDEIHIYLSTEYSGEDLNGLTWYVEQPEKVSLFINKEKYSNLQINLPDQSNRASVSIPWFPLSFPSMNKQTL